MRRKPFTTITLFLFLIFGAALLLYPSVSDYWNSFRQTTVINSYVQKVTNMSDEDYAKEWEKAYEFNKMIYDRGEYRSLKDEYLINRYNNTLNVAGNGVMGYVDIPSLHTTMAVYHGVEESVLQVGAGHMNGSSLPVGGVNTHAVLSGHRGLASAKLFTNLNELVEGDLFMLHVLDETLTYEIDRILIVEPDVMEPLNIDTGEDECTLLTCTPYGINTHRLLVRGHRVDNKIDYRQRISADARQIDPIVTAPFMAAPMIIVLLLWLVIKY